MKKNKFDQSLRKVKSNSYLIGELSSEKKSLIILGIEKILSKNKKNILEANKKDVEKTKMNGSTDAFVDRLAVTDKVFEGMMSELKAIAKLPNPIGEIIEKRKTINGLQLQKKRFPLGVILMIYESRPNVTVDAVGLCIKSGNAVILKGGSEAYLTNRIIVQLIHKVLKNFGIPENVVTLIKPISHADVVKLLTRSDIIDVVIPRGSYNLTSAVAKESRIPILYHASGGARMYIDKTADLKIAISVCINAKTQRVGVCNALDVILVHKDIAQKLLPELDTQFFNKEFKILAESKAKEYMKHSVLAKPKDFATEFLDKIVAVKIVNSDDEAINFIKKYTHGHTEALITKNKVLMQKFISEIDAAGIMINCSSRLHDGGEFGMGAEMGTATGKLHARGPVGVRELTTYKWIAYGNGQIRE